DVCVDLTGSSPLTQTEMTDFVPGRAVNDAAHRKRVKYETKCESIRYGFLSFSFSSFRELEEDAITLLMRIQKFSMTQDIGVRVALHIFNRIGFAIAKGYTARLSPSLRVANMIENNCWKWPNEWVRKYIDIVNIPIPSLISTENDKVRWKNRKGKCVKFNVKNVLEDLCETGMLDYSEVKEGKLRMLAKLYVKQSN
ncbi:hypothetical protein Tco_0036561, partial [Tanacetum coccineum]